MATKKKTIKKKSSSIYDDFEETSTRTLKTMREKEEEFTNTRNGSDFHSLDEGENKFRIYPKRKNIDDAFYRMHSVWWLPFKKDNGDWTRTKINNGKVHGKLNFDIIEEYVNQATRLLGTGDAEDNNKLEKITDWKNGIGNQVTFICYADKVSSKTKKNFGLWEMKPSLKDNLMKECIIEDEDEAIEVDPYTSPKHGKCAIVSYNKAKKGSDKYAVRLSKYEAPLTKEELEKFKTLPALYQHPLFNYGLQDFEKALECLENFDEEYEIGVFETSEFKSVIKKIKKQLSSSKAKYGHEKEEDEEDDDEEKPFDEDDIEEEDDDEEDDDDEGEDGEDGEDDNGDDDEDDEEESDDDDLVDGFDDDDDEEDDDDEGEEEEEKPKKKVNKKKKSEVSLEDIKKKLVAKKKKKK